MRSGFERTLAADLKRAKVSFEYETLTLPFIMNHTYRPDFILANGVVIEVKGILNRYDKSEASKLVAIKKQYPDLDFRLVFMEANKKITGTKQTHGAWATKHGFIWAEKSIPRSWYA